MKGPFYQHFIITRFNLVFNEFIQDKSGNKIQTDEWLQKRFDLFDWFCFPSIANQSNKAFKWLVLFSVNTPALFKEKISKYAALSENFVPVYLNDNADVDSCVANEIVNLLTGRETHLITTRIDNDDAFHKDMVALIQQEFNGQDDFYLNFNDGLQYDTSNHVLCSFNYKNNPFISRIEKLDNQSFKTVYDKRHDLAPASGAIKYIDSKPVWLQIIHDGNLVNTLYFKKMILSPAIVDDFNLNYSIRLSGINSVRLFIKYVFSRLMKKGKRLLKK